MLSFVHSSDMCPISDLCRVTSALSHQCYLSYQAHKFSFFCSSYCGIMCFRTLPLVFYLMLYQVLYFVLSLMLAVHCPVLPLVLSLMLYPEFSLSCALLCASYQAQKCSLYWSFLVQYFGSDWYSLLCSH